MSRKTTTLMRARDRDRRHLLRGAVAAAGSALLTGCDRLSGNDSFVEVLKSAQYVSRAAQKVLAPRPALAQEFAQSDVAPVFRSNGTLDPQDADYQALRRAGFASYRLTVGGLVEKPAEYTLDQLSRFIDRGVRDRMERIAVGAPERERAPEAPAPLLDLRALLRGRFAG